MTITQQYFNDRLKRLKLIVAVKDPKSLDKALRYKDYIGSVMLLTGNVLSVKEYVHILQRNGLPVLLDVDKIGGLKTDKYGMEFIRSVIQPFGIVTNKVADIKRAKAQQLYVVQRIFLIDTEVVTHIEDTLRDTKADMIELMPSRLPDIIRYVVGVSNIPIVTGGFVNERLHAEEALASGAQGIVTSYEPLWKVLRDEPLLDYK